MLDSPSAYSVTEAWFALALARKEQGKGPLFGQPSQHCHLNSAVKSNRCSKDRRLAKYHVLYEALFVVRGKSYLPQHPSYLGSLCTGYQGGRICRKGYSQQDHCSRMPGIACRRKARVESPVRTVISHCPKQVFLSLCGASC